MENSELITKALNYIKSQNKKSDITIEDVANHAGFSTDYFNRVFFAHTGFNIMEYVRFSRLKKAAHLLRGTNNDILDIASVSPVKIRPLTGLSFFAVVLVWCRVIKVATQ